MSKRIVMPSTSGGTYHSARMKRLDGKGLLKSAILGKGTGSFLLDGGIGGQNSYPSIPQYTATTGQRPLLGKGLEKLSAKISGLSIQPKKKRHLINFDL